MKVVKLVLGVLAALWTVGVIVGFAPMLLSMDFSTRGITDLATGVVAIESSKYVTPLIVATFSRRWGSDSNDGREALIV